jgi:hypothetical protein
MPTNGKKGKAAAAHRKAATLAHMLQGNGLVFNVGMLQNTTDLAPETRAAIVSMVLVDKSAMFRICLVKLSNVICNVEISDDFGLWITKDRTTHIQIPTPVQQYYNMTLDDPFPSFSMRTFNAGAMIRDHLKNLIEDYIDNNRTVCSCTKLDRLLLLIYELEITYVPIDYDGNIIHTTTPLILDRHADLCPLFKTHAMNHAITHINRPSRGQIRFQPALVYEFNTDASCIQMPLTGKQTRS